MYWWYDIISSAIESGQNVVRNISKHIKKNIYESMEQTREPEINLYTYGRWIFNKGSKNKIYYGGKTVFSANRVEIAGKLHVNQRD